MRWCGNFSRRTQLGENIALRSRMKYYESWDASCVNFVYIKRFHSSLFVRRFLARFISVCRRRTVSCSLKCLLIKWGVLYIHISSLVYFKDFLRIFL